jgi:DNA-binding LacI/PurR family transcriptional regulator
MQQKTNLTIDDIARHLEVSKTTVSRAISGKGRISPSTREKVLAYIKECNYRPNAAARALAESRTYNLALVIPRSFIKLDLPHVRQSMSSICEEAFLQDYNILVCLSTDDTSAALLRTLDNRKVDGVILSRTVENDKLVDILINQGIPFATMGTLPPAVHGKATVETDHDQVGGCRAFSMDFLHSGSGKVAVLGNDINYIVNKSRLSGVQQAMAACGYGEDQVTIRMGMQSETTCAQVVDQLLFEGVRRFLAMDDEICLRILEHLKERRLRIPEDVQIASLYDSDALAAYQPAISALQFDAAELGRVACRELLRCLKDTEYDPAPVLGYRILMRKST